MLEYLKVKKRVLNVFQSNETLHRFEKEKWFYAFKTNYIYMTG